MGKKIILITALMLASAAVYAERPLVVDDPGVVDVGHGHIETWFEKRGKKDRSWNLNAAIGIAKNLGIYTSFTKNIEEDRTTVSAIELKWQITEVKGDGCHVGGLIGISHENVKGGNEPYVKGLAGCYYGDNSVYLNFGISNPRNESKDKFLTNWGVAYERPLFYGVIGHIEYFSAKEDKPTFQVGLRRTFFDHLQLDGSIGRYDGETVFSLGMKISF